MPDAPKTSEVEDLLQQLEGALDPFRLAEDSLIARTIQTMRALLADRDYLIINLSGLHRSLERLKNQIDTFPTQCQRSIEWTCDQGCKAPTGLCLLDHKPVEGGGDVF